MENKSSVCAFLQANVEVSLLGKTKTRGSARKLERKGPKGEKSRGNARKLERKGSKDGVGEV